LPIHIGDIRDGSKASILACPQHVRLGGNLGNAGCPGLPVEGIGLDVIQVPDRSLESCGMNSRTLNGLALAAILRDARKRAPPAITAKPLRRDVVGDRFSRSIAPPLEDHKEEILLLAHGYRNLAEMKSWMAEKGN
jgi:hypothetical protein